jgi:hypothetical protein
MQQAQHETDRRLNVTQRGIEARRGPMCPQLHQLLRTLGNQSQHPEQDDGADKRDDETEDDPAALDVEETGDDPTADEGPDDPNDDIHDDPEAAPSHDAASQRSRNAADDDP